MTLFHLLTFWWFQPVEERPGNDSDSDAESETKMTEVRFVPEDRGLLEAMFQAMSACQALHPDPNDSVSEGIS